MGASGSRFLQPSCGQRFVTSSTALRTRADVIRQFLLFALEFRYHLYPPAAKRVIVAHPSLIDWRSIGIHPIEFDRTNF